MNFFYKYDSDENAIEKWKKVISAENISLGQWLFYVDDHYFGKVLHKESNRIDLHIQNFRVMNAAYVARISIFEKLISPEKWIWIDPDIQQYFPKIYIALEKCFRIWCKIEPYILSFKKEERIDITPTLFNKIGSIFANWSARGYINDSQLNFLNEIKFIEQVHNWQELSVWANDDNITDEFLDKIDVFTQMSFSVAKEKYKKEQFDFKLWLIIKSGFLGVDQM